MAEIDGPMPMARILQKGERPTPSECCKFVADQLRVMGYAAYADRIEELIAEVAKLNVPPPCQHTQQHGRIMKLPRWVPTWFYKNKSVKPDEVGMVTVPFREWCHVCKTTHKPPAKLHCLKVRPPEWRGPA